MKQQHHGARVGLLDDEALEKAVSTAGLSLSHRHALDPAVVGMSADPVERLTAADLCWTPQPAIWPSSRAVLALVIETLPKIKASLPVDLVEHLALGLVDRDDELRAVRAVLSATLTHAHAQDIEIVRLRRRVADLLDARQRERRASDGAASERRTVHPGRTGQGSTEEKSLYEKRRVDKHSAAKDRTYRAGQRPQISAVTDRAGKPWT